MFAQIFPQYPTKTKGGSSIRKGGKWSAKAVIDSCQKLVREQSERKA